MTPSANGKWKEKLLVKFNGNNGENPQASLVLDPAGNLYGETDAGGFFRGSGCDNYGGTCGTVFEATP